MDFLHLAGASSQDTGINRTSTTYDSNAISPTTIEPDTMSKHHNMPSQRHVTIGHVRRSQSQLSVDGGLEESLHNYIVSLDRFGQVIPLENANMQEPIEPFSKLADLGACRIDVNAVAAASTCPPSLTTFKRPSVMSSRKSRKHSRVPDDTVVGDKKDKYRQKNRVAAAKCRARKKEQADLLEETHNTQSALNTALKQTEKASRDELSLWRTQALQHTFCGCHSIQEYNLRKAQSMTLKISHTTVPCSDTASSCFSLPCQNNFPSPLDPEKGSSMTSDALNGNSFVYSNRVGGAHRFSPVAPSSAVAVLD